MHEWASFFEGKSMEELDALAKSFSFGTPSRRHS